MIFVNLVFSPEFGDLDQFSDFVEYCKIGNFGESDDSGAFVETIFKKETNSRFCCFSCYSNFVGITFNFSLCMKQNEKIFLLFSFGTERMEISKICKRWWWGGGGTMKMNQNRFIHFYFLLIIFKNRLKWIKNPSLHDSRESALHLFYFYPPQN